MDTATARPTVFISYSHLDEAWKNRLVKQLRVLQLKDNLAERVDGLPLALEQAAAYIIRHRMRFAE